LSVAELRLSAAVLAKALAPIRFVYNLASDALTTLERSAQTLSSLPDARLVSISFQYCWSYQASNQAPCRVAEAGIAFLTFVCNAFSSVPDFGLTSAHAATTAFYNAIIFTGFLLLSIFAFFSAKHLPSEAPVAVGAVSVGLIKHFLPEVKKL
jgi:hypothetical protein